MSMVPIGSILSSLPTVYPTATWLNGLLCQTWDTIRPWGTMLFNAVEMDRGVEGHIIVHNDLDTISIIDLVVNIQSQTIPQHRHPGQNAVRVQEIDHS